MRARPLSLVLSNNTLALLDQSYMRRYFAARLKRWFGVRSMGPVEIHEHHSPVEFKKSIRYTLHLQESADTERIVLMRANVPSLDTTHEARDAFRAMRAIETYDPKGTTLPISKPLGFDAKLRALFYEEVQGIPLETAMLAKSRHATLLVGQAASWLKRLHAARLSVGPLRTIAMDRRDAYFFSLNFGRFYPQCQPITQPLLARILEVRAKLNPIITKSSVLLHGDYNPGNVIVGTNAVSGVIDFGNTRRFDPLADAANGIVQIALLGWRKDITPKASATYQRAFLRGYFAKGAPSKQEGVRFAMFEAWWSLQSLSYILNLDFLTNKTPLIKGLLANAVRAGKVLR